MENFTDLFHLPVSQQSLVQMQNLQADIAQCTLTEHNDKWGYIWGTANFSSARIYKELMDHPVVHPAFRWLWENSCQPKHKVFFWLLLKDRLSTRNLLKRKRMALESYNCVLCNSLEETAQHLFLSCSFARQCWNYLGISFPNRSDFPVVVTTFKTRLQSILHGGYHPFMLVNLGNKKWLHL